MSNIPLRPKSGRFNLQPEEAQALSYYVLFKASQEDAFIRFVRPDFMVQKSKTIIKDAVKQFFANKDVREYIDAYKETLDEYDNGSPKQKETPTNIGSLEDRKRIALTKLVEYVLGEANKIGTEDQGDIKSIMEFANRIGLFEQKEDQEEVPRRYLPVTCNECEYRKFVEENCERVEDGTEIAEENKNEQL